MTFAILGVTARVYCYQAEVIDISGKRYFPAVKEALSKAQKSIYLVMYFVNFDPDEIVKFNLPMTLDTAHIEDDKKIWHLLKSYKENIRNVHLSSKGHKQQLS
ncbi:MAG: hypothetical protein Q8O30_05270 [Candidatus Omnitrophota bacterium]|nr:hypothetical protein [Candidatus Omnitrophota bacterium]